MHLPNGVCFFHHDRTCRARAHLHPRLPFHPQLRSTTPVHPVCSARPSAARALAATSSARHPLRARTARGRATRHSTSCTARTSPLRGTTRAGRCGPTKYSSILELALAIAEKVLAQNAARCCGC
eukprot:5999876-Prymnesium_polylepis.1